ncbi:5'-nucleotidase C-terminal domain-containing protein [Evansella halocellulosilytica]|uniref:5'-nucleotidase C-terminal domain-containing protein n=1 Tax=Evansella halocellulosilytica TaxID=2011013 RepID=UPI0015CBEA00|nr:5'-nucleotidase C-terminal domain-containing protein [Evansella halocellulosilytica]
MKKGLLSLLTAVLFISLIGVHPADAAKSDHVTKGAFLVALLDTIGVDVAPYEDAEVSYSDVSEELVPYIEAATRLNLINDSEDAMFGPNEKMTREQAYVLLVRSLNLLHDYDEDYLDQFRDARAVSDWAKSDLAAAAALDLLEGFHNKTIRPKAPLTSDYMEGMFDRYDGNFERLSFVATNDLHGRILHSDENGEMGMAKISTIVNEIRDQNEQTFLFDAGDTFHGTNYVNFSEGAAAVEVMNAMEYDGMVLGNHDFNFGQERLTQLFDMAEFPVMSGNVRYEENDEFLTDPYVIFEVDGKEIAVLTMTAEDTTVKTAPANIEGLHFEYETEAIQTLVDEVKDDVDHIFLLSHAGYTVDKQMVDAVDGIDFIMGGHSHSTIEYPELYEDTYITQAWEHGKAVSVNHVLFHDGEFVGINGYLARDHENLEEDRAIKTILDDIEEEVGEAMSEVVANIDVDLDGSRENVRTQETNLGNLITDAMKDLTDADIAFTNGGGIRANIAAGDVTVGDVFEAFPFANYVIMIEVTGEDILQSAEHGVRLYPNENGGFLHVSGMSYTFDPSQPEGERIVELLIDGEPVDPDATYHVATNDFMASGGDGFSWLADGELLADTGQLLSEVLINYLQADKQIPEVEGRINVQ